MKTKGKVVTVGITAILVSLVLFAGCTEVLDPKDAFIGTWKGSGTSTVGIPPVNAQYRNVSLTFLSTGVMTMSIEMWAEVVPGTWSYIITVEDSGTWDIVDGKLTMTSDLTVTYSYTITSSHLDLVDTVSTTTLSLDKQ